MLALTRLGASNISARAELRLHGVYPRMRISMAESKMSPGFSVVRKTARDCRRGVSKKVPANLTEAGGKVIITGEALLFPDEREALFYPSKATPAPVGDPATTLLLTNINAPLSIAQIEDCSEKGSQE